MDCMVGICERKVIKQMPVDVHCLRSNARGCRQEVMLGDLWDQALRILQEESRN